MDRPLALPSGILDEDVLVRHDTANPYRNEQPAMNQPMQDTLGRANNADSQ